VGRNVSCIQTKLRTEGKQLITATQILRKIYLAAKTTRSLRSANTLAELQYLKYTGDDSMATFRNRLDEFFLDLGNDISEEGMCTIMLDYFDQSVRLAGEAAHFRRLPEGHPDKTSNWLRDALDREITRITEKRNVEERREYFENLNSGRLYAATAEQPWQVKGGKRENKKGRSQSQGPNQKGKGGKKGGGRDNRSPSPSGKKKGEGKGTQQSSKWKGPDLLSDPVLQKRDSANKAPCIWFHTPSGCRKGATCPYSHIIQLSDAEKKTVNNIATRMKSRSPSRERKGKNTVCRQFQEKGSCARGDKCLFLHRK